MHCRIISLLIWLGVLVGYSNAAPSLGSSEECYGRCHRMGLASQRMCLQPPCEKWKFNDLCVVTSSKDSPSDISADDTTTNSDFSSTKKSSSIVKEFSDENSALKRLVVPKYLKVHLFKNRFMPFMKRLAATNTIVTTNPNHYERKYAQLGGKQISIYFPYHKLLESTPVPYKMPETNEQYSKVTLPFQGKDSLTVALGLLSDRQSSYITSESSETANNGMTSSKTVDPVIVADANTRSKGTESSRVQNSKVKKEKENKIPFPSSENLRKKLVSKRSINSIGNAPFCCPFEENPSRSRLRGRGNIHISSSKSDGYGMSVSAAHHGSSFAFGNGQSILSDNRGRAPVLRVADFPELPSIPQLPAVSRMPSMSFF